MSLLLLKELIIIFLLWHNTVALHGHLHEEYTTDLDVNIIVCIVETWRTDGLTQHLPSSTKTVNKLKNSFYAFDRFILIKCGYYRFY